MVIDSGALEKTTGPTPILHSLAARRSSRVAGLAQRHHVALHQPELGVAGQLLDVVDFPGHTVAADGQTVHAKRVSRYVPGPEVLPQRIISTLGRVRTGRFGTADTARLADSGDNGAATAEPGRGLGHLPSFVPRRDPVLLFDAQREGFQLGPLLRRPLFHRSLLALHRHNDPAHHARLTATMHHPAIMVIQSTAVATNPTHRFIVCCSALVAGLRSRWPGPLGAGCPPSPGRLPRSTPPWHSPATGMASCRNARASR